MVRSFRFSSRGRPPGASLGLAAGCFLGIFSAWPSFGADLPPALLSQLGAEQFRTREAAELELLAWARQRPEAAMDQLLRESRAHGEPEVRERCLAVLKELVNDEFLRDGEGYVGISMRDDTLMVPGDDRLRHVIRVMHVMRESAAHKAGIVAGDVIVGTSEDTWYDGRASEQFSVKIQRMRPKTRVVLKLLRENEVVDVAIALGRRPDENAMRQGDPRVAEAAARRARDDFFEAWLKKQEADKP